MEKRKTKKPKINNKIRTICLTDEYLITMTYFYGLVWSRVCHSKGWALSEFPLVIIIHIYLTFMYI